MSTDAADLNVTPTTTEIISNPDSPVVDTGEVIDGAVETQATEEFVAEGAPQVATPVIPEGYISVEEHQRRLEQSRHDTAQSAADRLLQQLDPLLQQARAATPQPVDPVAKEIMPFVERLQRQVEDGIMAQETMDVLVHDKYETVQRMLANEGQQKGYAQYVQQQNAQAAEKLYSDTLAAQGIQPNTPEFIAVQTEAGRIFSLMQPGSVTQQDIVNITSMVATNVKTRSAALKQTKPAGNTTIEPGAATATVPQSDYNPDESLVQMFERKKREALAAEGLG